MNAIQSNRALPARRGWGGTWLIVVVLILVLVGVGGTLLWNFAVARAGSTFDALLSREAERGHTWTCPQRQFSGYPLRVALDCVGPTFAGTAGGREITGSAKSLHAQFAIYQPDRLTAEIEGPVEIASADGKAVTLTWASAQISALGLPFGIDRIDLEIDKPAAQVKSDAPEPLSLGASGVSVQLHRLTPASAQDPDLEVMVDVAGAAMPLLDKIMGSSEPANLDVLASIHQAALLDRGNLAERLEAWRAGGGQLDIAHATLLKGPANVAASGRLAIDDAHRPQGEVNLSLAGVDGIMRRFGLPVQASGLGGLLGGLMGKKANAQSLDASSSKALRLGLSIADGHVSMGPLPLPVSLRPLY